MEDLIAAVSENSADICFVCLIGGTDNHIDIIDLAFVSVMSDMFIFFFVVVD